MVAAEIRRAPGEGSRIGAMHGHEHPLLREPVADPEALIREARRRTRRRRAVIAAAALAAGGLAVGLLAAGSGGRGAAAGPRLSGPRGLPYSDARAFRGHGNLAFVSRGRLFVLDGATGRLTAVSTAAQASTPQFSPNGRWLLYSVGSTAWLARGDGSGARTLAAAEGGHRNAWLPDGRLVLGAGIFRVGPGGGLRRVGSAPSDLAAWSPDGDRFAFWSHTVTRGSGGRWHEVFRLELASSLSGPRTVWYESRVSFTPKSGIQGNEPDRTLVLPRRQGVLFTLDPDAAVPTWSRSSRSLMYVADDALWLIPHLGARPVEIVAPLFPTSDWPSYYGEIDWTDQFSWWSG